MGKIIFWIMIGFGVSMFAGSKIGDMIDPGPAKQQITITNKKTQDVKTGKTSYSTQNLVAYHNDTTNVDDYFQTDPFQYDKYQIGQKMTVDQPSYVSYGRRWIGWMLSTLILGCITSALVLIYMLLSDD